MSKKPPKHADVDENPLDITRRILVGGLQELEGSLRDDDASDYAHTLTKVAQVQAELRKADAEERRRGEALTPAVVVEWFRSLQDAEQGSLLRELEVINRGKKRSGLA